MWRKVGIIMYFMIFVFDCPENITGHAQLIPQSRP